MIMDINREINRFEYENQSTVLKSFPQIVFVETTRNCNLKCTMCERAKKYGSYYSRELDMDIRTLLRVSETLFDKAEIIDFHGNGEFLCFPFFFEAIDLALKHNCKIRTVTNLCTTNRRKIKALASSIDYLCVSLDSPNKKTYESLRIGGDFDVVIDNLRYLVQSGRNDVIVMMTIAYDNLYELNDMIKFISSLGLKKLYVWQRFLPKFDENNIIHHLEESKRYFSRVVNNSAELGVELRMLSWPKHNSLCKDSLPCLKPWMSVHINYDGTIGMCDFNETPLAFDGLSIIDSDFDAIWNSSQYTELRHRHIAKEQIEFCSELCIGKRFVDFEELIYPQKGEDIISGERILDVL